MAKKSAASAKIKQPEKPKAPLEERFEKAKQALIDQIEIQIQIADRVDNMGNIRDFYKNFYGKFPTFNKSQYLLGVSVGAYKGVLAAVQDISFEQMKTAEFDDPFLDLIPKPKDVKTDEDLYEALLIWLSVSPYANKVVQLHQLVQDELAKEE
jgi:hypothetical protein